MPCVYDRCPNQDEVSEADPLLRCDRSQDHTIHLTCWARWGVDLGYYEGLENLCPVEMCDGGVAEHPAVLGEEGARLAIAEAARDLALYYVQAPPPDTDELPQLMEEEYGGEPTDQEPWAALDELLRQLQEEGSQSSDEPQFAGRTDCAICAEDFAIDLASGVQGGDYARASAWWCSGALDDRQRNVYCSACAMDRLRGVCPDCRAHMLVEASVMTVYNVVPQPLQFGYSFIMPNCEGRGVRQEYMLCYAAATATAVLWATGRQLTIWECMHTYMMSDQAPHLQVENVSAYRDAFNFLRGLDAFRGLTDAQIVNDVIQKSPDYKRIADNAATEFGSPVFPADVPAVLYHGGMTAQAVRDALEAGRPVMQGAGIHWSVVFGVFGATRDDITHVRIYDPMPSQCRIVRWSGNATFFVVG